MKGHPMCPESEPEPIETPKPVPQQRRNFIRTLPAWALPMLTAIVGIAIGASAVAATEPETVTVTETVTIDPAEEDHFDLLQREGAVTQRELDAAELSAELDVRESQLQEWEDELYNAEAEVAANAITDGIWTVGVDIEPGTYRAEDVSSDCYWAILESGSNGSDIVDNAIPGGGNPSVTLEEGWDFESSACGDWTKQ